MSVELTLMVGRISDSLRRDGAFWFSPIVILEMLAWPRDSALHRLLPEDRDPPVFFFGSDGNTRIGKDKYGTRLRATRLDRVIAALEQDCGDEMHWSLACLRELRKWAESLPSYWDVRAVMYYH